MVKPIRKVIRNKALLSVLATQFPVRTELGLEYVNGWHGGPDIIHETFRVYTRKGNEDWNEDRFVIERVKRGGKIREYRLEGRVYFSQ